MKILVDVLDVAPSHGWTYSKNIQKNTNDTYKTKLKLDKEVGGGDLSELCTITYLIANP